MGWENFQVSVIEICKISELGTREHYYLKEYLPLLNTAFNSKYTEAAIFKNLNRLLASKRKEPLKINQGIKTSIWVYEIDTTQIEKTFVKYDSINKASLGTGRSRDSIQRYLNTNVPIKGFLYYTSPIVDFDTAFNLAKSSFGELKIDSNISKKVWVYVIKNDKVILVNNQPFPSREQTAKFLNTIGNTIRYYTDSWKSQGLNGYYLFSKPLDSTQLNSLLELSKEKPLVSKILVRGPPPLSSFL